MHYTLSRCDTASLTHPCSNLLFPLSNITLQATGIAFNVVIIRSTSRRDEEFSVFDQNERAIIESHQPVRTHSIRFADMGARESEEYGAGVNHIDATKTLELPKKLEIGRLDVLRKTADEQKPRFRAL